MAAQHIVDGCALLPLDAERHDLNTTMMVSKQAGKPDPIYFNNIIEAQVKIMSIIIKKNCTLSTSERGWHPVVLHCCLWQCLLVAIWPTHANRHASTDREGHVLPTNVWQLA